MAVTNWAAYRERSRLRMSLQATSLRPKTPGARLKRARLLMGLTLKDACLLANVTRSTFQRREAGDLNLDTTFETARGLGIDPHYLDPRLSSDGGRRFD